MNPSFDLIIVGAGIAGPTLALSLARLDALVPHRIQKIGLSATVAEEIEALRRVSIPEPERRARQYPHEYSGGMAQRAALAREQGWRRVLLVTTASHLRRSEAAFRKAGVEIIAVACDFDGLDALDESAQLWKVIPEGTLLTWFQTWFHEVAGWWWYRARGWVS